MNSEAAAEADMPFLFIPSENSPSKKLFICLKVFNNKFWKIPVEISIKQQDIHITNNKSINCEKFEEKETENRLDLEFKLEDKTFGSLNEVTQYLIKTLHVLNTFHNHRKFSDYKNTEHLRDMIQKKNKLNSLTEYSYTIFSEYPLHVLLAYFIKKDFILEFIKVTPVGFIYSEKAFSVPDKISNYFKENFHYNSSNIHKKAAQALLQEQRLKQIEDEFDLNQEGASKNELLPIRTSTSSCSPDVEMSIDCCGGSGNNSLKDIRKVDEELKLEEADQFMFLGVKRERSRSPMQVLKVRDSIPEIFKENAEKRNEHLIGIGVLIDQRKEKNADYVIQENINAAPFEIQMQIEKDENAFDDIKQEKCSFSNQSLG